MKTLKVWFHNFWGGFNPESNYFTDMFECNGNEVIITDRNPDIVFESWFGHTPFTGKGTKFFFSGENKPIPSNYQGFSLSFSSTAGNNYRLPLWAFYINWYRRPDKGNPKRILIDSLTAPKQISNDAFNRRFCNFIYNNPNGNERNSICSMLMAYKDVSCLGRWYNDNQHVLGGDENDKIAAMRNYKFSIAGENSLGDGYVTEKILHAFAANTIPIYWGSPVVADDFNAKAFINSNTYNNLLGDFDIEMMINDIKLIDKSEKFYTKMLSEPIFNNNEPPSSVRPIEVYKWIIERM